MSESAAIASSPSPVTVDTLAVDLAALGVRPVLIVSQAGTLLALLLSGTGDWAIGDWATGDWGLGNWGLEIGDWRLGNWLTRD